MNTTSCCQHQARTGAEARRSTFRWRRGGEVAGWIVPGVTLALLPKCPACVAAYVALATGIGISLPTAHSLRGILVTACVAALAFMLARRWRGFFPRKSPGRWRRC